MLAPERILPTRGGLETNTVGASRLDAGAGADFVWDSDIKHVRNVPDWWWVEWLVDASGGHLSKVAVREVIQNISDNFGGLLFFSLPKECSNRKVCSRTFSRRDIDVGGRRKVMYTGVGADCGIDWIPYGCFSSTIDQAGGATQLKHLTSITAAIPDHLRIMKQL